MIRPAVSAMHSGKTDNTRISVQLRRQVAALCGGLDRTAAALTAEPTPAAIHNTRVAARRLRVLLQAYSRELDSKARKRYRRELKALTGDLEPAREADVARRLIVRLVSRRSGHIDGNPRAIHERALFGYQSEVESLRAVMTGAAWRQRLAELRRMSALPSLVKENKKSAVTVTHRLIMRRRRRLRAAFANAGSSPARLHRIRLKIKAMRYLLEGRLSKSAIAKSHELKRLREIQKCLGDMRDQQNVLKVLRTARADREAARDLSVELKKHKHRQLRSFKKYREALVRLWDGVACVDPRSR